MVAEMLGISDVLYRKPKTLTAAQRLLATYGRAVVREPKIYLFDDPLSGLDEKLKEQMRGVLVSLQARVGGTFVYATKNIADAMSMATRIVVLKDGFVQQIDSPRNLYDYPANEYVAFFAGSPAMNFMRRAKAERDEGGVYCDVRGVKIYLPENILARWQDAEEYIGTGREVTLGIRPEDIKAGGEGAVYEGVVSGAEPYEDGVSEVELAKGVSLSVLLSKPVKGEKCKVSADLSRLYVFDGETTLSLLSRDGGYAVDEGNEDAAFVPLIAAEAEEQMKLHAPAEAPKSKRR